MTDPRPLDPAFAAMLADPRVMLRPPPPGMAMTAYRERLDRPMAVVAGPDMLAVEAARTGCGVPLRVYRPEGATAATIVFLHGGGFVTGSLDTHDALCRMLAAASGATVVAAGYRLAPEHPPSATAEDCRAALRWAAAARPDHRLSLCGDSAGGYLATATALRAGEDGIAPAALGLLYPVVGPACATASWELLGTGHMLTREWMRWAWATRLGPQPAGPGDDLLHGDLLHADLLHADLLHEDLRRLPPTHVITAAFDPLRDEGEALAAAIAAQGGTATVSRYPGMIHGFASLPMLTRSAGQAIAEIGRALTSQQRC